MLIEHQAGESGASLETSGPRRQPSGANGVRDAERRRQVAEKAGAAAEKENATVI
jgi:hypothetical protein